MARKSLSHDFDQIAPYYDSGLKMLLFAFGTEAKMRRRIADALKCENLLKGAKILEVGCGTGSNLKAIDESCPACYELAGVDISVPMLEQAKKKQFASRVEFIQADASDRLPFEDESFESVLIVYTIHEMPEPERKGTVSEVHRVLKSGGCVLVTDYSRPTSLFGRTVFPFLRLIESSEALEFAREGPDPLFSQAGFRKESEEPLLFGIVRVSLYRRE
jgi:ubiquinone/menaquinone biosynthesis C-methylase UbiE